MRPLRIILVEFSPSGGLFQFAFQLGQALAGAGHEVELVTGPDPELVATTARFRVTPLLPTWGVDTAVVSPWRHKARRVVRAGRHVAAWLVLVRHVRRQRPDVVQLAEWRFPVDGYFAAILARAGWAAAVTDLAHSPIPLEEIRSGSEYKSGRLLTHGLATGYRRMATVFVLGEESKRDLLRAFPQVRRCDVIPHGDERALAGAPVPPADQCPMRAVFFGALSGYKGLHLLLEAWALVEPVLPDAELLIAGPVTRDLDLAGLQDQARRLKHVDLRPGYVPIPDVAALVGSGRLVVAPYTRSNASGVVRLAHTLERPLIVTRVGDLADTVTDGRSGIVVPPADARRLADALIELLPDAARCTELGKAGKLAIEAGATWPHVARRVEQVYGSLLEAGRHST